MNEENVTRIPVDMSAKPLPLRKAGTCPHRQTMADCSVTYLQDLRRFVLEVKVVCKQCLARFRFQKIPAATSVTEPCVDVSGYTVSLPIVPGDPA